MLADAHTEQWCPSGWVRHEYVHGDHEHNFYVVDPTPTPSRRSVLLLHEFPGIDKRIVSLADRLSADFRVVLPSMFGVDGSLRAWDSVKQICVRREVHLIARGSASKSVVWLKDFIDKHVAPEESPYGVVGMCFSGNFALALAVDDQVKAAIVAQPSLPLFPSSLGLSRSDQKRLKERTDLCVRGYRYYGDQISPAVKLASAARLLDPGRIQTFTLSAAQPTHSTLTGCRPSAFALADMQRFLVAALRSGETEGQQGQ
jgi:dienelactone hydrolase